MCISVSSPYAEEAIEPSELKLPLILATPEETVLRRLDIAEDTVDLMLLKAEVVVDFSVFQPLVTVLRTADTEEVVRLLMLEKMADIFHVPLTYLQPDQSLFIERAAEAYGKKGKIEAQHLAFELTELFASGELTPQDMDGIMYEMHKAYFKYREQKREKERIMNL